MMIALILAAAANAATGPAESTPPPEEQTSEEQTRYERCLSALEQDLEEGRRLAQRWAAEGGGADALHCQAIADIKAGFPKLSAARLEMIAQRKDAGDDLVRARLLSQAARAWLEADDPQRAEAAIMEALALAPESGELQLTAAAVYGAQEEWQQVIDAVTSAERAGFKHPDAYVLRGRAYYTFGDIESAAQDVVNALSLEPTHIEALVLRGKIQQRGVAIDVYYDPPAPAGGDGE